MRRERGEEEEFAMSNLTNVGKNRNRESIQCTNINKHRKPLKKISFMTVGI
jgi:hypothetical protein